MARAGSTPAADATAAAGWRPWGTLAGLFLLTAGFIAHAIAPASLLPLFVAAFPIDRATAGASISAVFLTWALLQIPGGFVVDRAENRRVVALASGGFLLAAVAGGWLIGQCSWIGGFAFAMGLAVVGLGTILLVPAVTTAAADG